MAKVSLIPEEVSSFSYYEKLTPLYLQNSETFMKHFEIFYEMGFLPEGSQLLCNQALCDEVVVGQSRFSVLNLGIELFKFLDIFTVLNPTRRYEDVVYITNSTKSDVLDKLAKLFGISRNFSIPDLVGEDEDATKEISLNDSDLLMLIRCQVIKNFFNGTFEDLLRCYKLINLPILPLTDSINPAHCKIYLLLSNIYEVSQNVKDMFLAGLLSIESMGIYYTYAIQVAENIAVFDSTLSSSSFDLGQFVI